MTQNLEISQMPTKEKMEKCGIFINSRLLSNGEKGWASGDSMVASHNYAE